MINAYVTLCIAANISKRNFAWIMERDIPVFHLPYDNVVNPSNSWKKDSYLYICRLPYFVWC